jgi:hypothetical protein
MGRSTRKQKTKSSPATSAGREIPGTARRGNFLAMRLQPGEHVTIGEMLPKGVMAVQSHGPGGIQIDLGYCQINLPPDHLRLVSTSDRISLASVDEKPAIIELEFMLAPK